MQPPRGPMRARPGDVIRWGFTRAGRGLLRGLPVNTFGPLGRVAFPGVGAPERRALPRGGPCPIFIGPEAPGMLGCAQERAYRPQAAPATTYLLRARVCSGPGPWQAVFMYGCGVTFGAPGSRLLMSGLPSPLGDGDLGTGRWDPACGRTSPAAGLDARPAGARRGASRAGGREAGGPASPADRSTSCRLLVDRGVEPKGHRGGGPGGARGRLGLNSPSAAFQVPATGRRTFCD